MTIRLSRASTLGLIASAPLAGVPFRLSAEPIRIRFGSSPADTYAEPFYAIEKGFFKEAGIEIDLTMIPAASAIAQAVAANALDVGLCDPIQIAHPVNAGVPLAFFAGGGLYSAEAPATLLVGMKSSPFKTARDLEGQNLAVISLASVSTLAVREWLRQGGAEVGKVKIIEMPFSTMVPALERGTIGAAFLTEPYVSQSRDQLSVIAPAFSAIAKSFYISGWFASRDWIAKNLEVTKRLASVAYASAKWANANHAESAPIIAQYSKIPIDAVKSMTRTPYATSLDPRQIQPLLDVAYRYGQLDKPVDAATLIVRV
jgi:NitT/TauT family transport system substrate-binding protein